MHLIFNRLDGFSDLLPVLQNEGNRRNKPELGRGLYAALAKRTAQQCDDLELEIQPDLWVHVEDQFNESEPLRTGQQVQYWP